MLEEVGRVLSGQPTMSFGSVARAMASAARGPDYAWEGHSLATRFQPIFCVERGKAIGDEALLRVKGGRGSTRLLLDSLDVERAVLLDRVARALHLRNYAVVDREDRELFVNVHPAALADDLQEVHLFAQLARYYGLKPERICLEIQPHSCADENLLTEVVARCREEGFSIALDQFGSGHANLDRVARLRPRLVKLDRSVVATAFGDSPAKRQLPAFIELLKGSGARVVMTGIEDAADAIAAVEAGADYLQGYHLGAPRATLGDDALSEELLRNMRVRLLYSR